MTLHSQNAQIIPFLIIINHLSHEHLGSVDRKEISLILQDSFLLLFKWIRQRNLQILIWCVLF